VSKLDRGMPAPDFEARDADGRTWKLKGLRGRKVILYFYPADDTPGCTKEACDFRDAHSVFEKANYVVLGVSPQDAQSHRDFAAKHDLGFPLLVDEDLALATAYGVVGNFGDHDGTPLRVSRSTFVIDEHGTIERALYGVRARGHVDKLRQSVAV
jgi:thioredoxin-dependent peroxiredoxin